MRGVLRVEGGWGFGDWERGAASDYESLRPVKRWPVGELVLLILSDAEERFQAFLVLTHSAIYTCSQFNNHLYYQITKPDTGTSLRVRGAKLPYHGEVLLLVSVILSLLCPLKMLHISIVLHSNSSGLSSESESDISDNP